MTPGRLVLIGHPVSHSLSPAIQNAALSAAGLNMSYEAIDVAPSELNVVLDQLRQDGAAGNVTTPYKLAVFEQCKTVSGVAERTRAVNTFWFNENGMQGANTDVTGFDLAVTGLLGDIPGGQKVVILGSGGAAAAVLAAIEAWPDSKAIVVSRNEKSARDLVERFSGFAERGTVSPTTLKQATLLVNATPVGQHDNAIPVDVAALDSNCRVLDLVYGKDGTPLVRAARKRGLLAEDGTAMLIEQAAMAFERWFSVPADRAAMRAAIS